MGSPLDTFERQAQASARIGSPFTAALCRAVPEALGETALLSRVRNWPGDPDAEALALRVCGGLHALVLAGVAPDLLAAYPPNQVEAAALRAALAGAIVAHDAFLTTYLDTPPQTNETGRSSMILGAALHVARQTGLPLALFEIGASAGLNLWFSEFHFDFGGAGTWGDVGAPVEIASAWSGNLPPLGQPLRVVSRLGCDRNPLDPADPDDGLRLLSYIWPDQPERLARMRRALDHAARRPVAVERADAADWAEQRLAETPIPGVVRFHYHTLVWQYLSAAVRARIDAAFDKAGAAATAETPLAMFRFENDMRGDGGLMELTLWPGGERRALGRASFHGGWARWT